MLPAPPPPPPPPPPPGDLPSRQGNRSRRAALAVAGTLIAGVAIGVPLGILTRGGSTPSPTASPAPTAASSAVVQARALYQQALSTANSSAGFHYVAVSKGPDGNQTIDGRAGQSGGTQQITMDSTYGPEQFTLLLLNGTVYFQGNGPALQDQLGVPAANTATLVARLDLVASGDAPYSVVAPGITVADQVGETTLVPTSTNQVNSDTARVIGTIPPQQGTGSAHLSVDSRTHLPISFVTTVTGNGSTTTSTVTFSGWGTAPSVSAPPTSVAWSTLGASQPPGGYGSGGHSASPTPQA